MLNPLMMMGVLSLVFANLMRVHVANYPVYVLSGILFWNVFSQSVLMGVHSIVNNASLLRKVRVPAWVFPTATIGTAITNLLLAFVPYVILSVLLHNRLGITAVQMIPLIGCYFFFVHGVVLTLSCWNTRFRDVGHVMEPVLQIGFYSTPILYSLEVLPEQFRSIIQMNPLYPFLRIFRYALVDHQWAGAQIWAICLIIGLSSYLIGQLVHRRMEGRLFYYL
jgi:ABC-type polysaccharide/polyol phosphate export permease